MTIKAQVLETINNLPDGSDYEDIIYALYVRERIEIAEREIADGKLLTEAQARTRLSKWLS